MPEPKSTFRTFLETYLPHWMGHDPAKMEEIVAMLDGHSMGSVARTLFNVGGVWNRLLEERIRVSLHREVVTLDARVTELLEDATKAADRTLHRMVRAFHLKFGHAVRWTPTIPPDEEVRVRMRLIAEEFFEAMEACGFAGRYGNVLDDARKNISDAITELDVKVDLPEFIDALGDLAYVIEGGTAVCGVVMQPVMEEIQRANMSKEPNGPLGKPTKPEGWTPPDIARVLLDQGWDPKALPEPSRQPQVDDEADDIT